MSRPVVKLEIELGRNHGHLTLQETLDEALRTARASIKASLMSGGPGRFYIMVERIEDED